MAIRKPPISRPAPVEMEFAPGPVHALLVQVTAGDSSIVVPPAEHPAILGLATMLEAFRQQVIIERGAPWAKGARVRQMYAEISPKLAEVIAGFREETAEAVKRCDAKIDPMTGAGVEALLARKEHRVGIAKLEEFEVLRQWFDRNLFYQDPATLGTVDFWDAYAEPLSDAFAAAVTRTGASPKPVRNPLYRFLCAVIPCITGERPTFDAVETRLEEKRPVNWAKGGFPP